MCIRDRLYWKQQGTIGGGFQFENTYNFKLENIIPTEEYTNLIMELNNICSDAWEPISTMCIVLCGICVLPKIMQQTNKLVEAAAQWCKDKTLQYKDRKIQFEFKAVTQSYGNQTHGAQWIEISWSPNMYNNKSGGGGNVEMNRD
eukprot:TRINITY_DN12348_c0_g4_i1.p1 TRINITY_DN12348_c0_g4~~TRINITY_DN12348_c0_g4_i1.p1  ORF type:complete len:145 (-),score=18.07 TRINITY_DN12348_c0_g4_i1:24-458(-)